MHSNQQRHAVSQAPTRGRVKPAGQKRPKEVVPVIVDAQGQPYDVQGLLRQPDMGLDGHREG